MTLKGKTAIITGGGRDIGRACALRLAAEGANVAISYLASADGANSAVAEIEKQGGKAIAVQADLSTEAGVAALVDATVAAFGGVDILVNNAGGLIARKTIADMSLEQWLALWRAVGDAVAIATSCAQHARGGGHGWARGEAAGGRTRRSGVTKRQRPVYPCGENSLQPKARGGSL